MSSDWQAKSKYGRIAQSVEQRIENPRVPGSIPGSATTFYIFCNSHQTVIVKESTRIEPGPDSVAQHIHVLRPPAHGTKAVPCPNLLRVNLVQVRPPLFIFSVIVTKL